MNDRYVKQEEIIKNCPFCGSSVSVERVPLKHYKGCVIFEIKCLNCGCERSLLKNDSIYRTEEEARANAIAQWNERADVPPVPREMSAMEYERALWRMHENRPFCSELKQYTEIFDTRFGDLLAIKKAIAIIEKWAREHPEENNE